MRRLRRLWRGRSADVLGFMLVLAVGAGAAAVFVFAADRSQRQVSLAPSVTQLPTCSEAGPALGADGRARCRDGGAAVELVGGKRRLVLHDLEVRVLGVERLGHALGVRLRLRNTSAQTRVVRDGRHQMYVADGGRRVYGRIGRVLHMNPRTDVTAKAWFKGVDRTRRGKRRVWLGVVPFAEVARAHPSRLGMIRLDVPPKGSSGKAPSSSQAPATDTTPATPTAQQPTTTTEG